MMMLMTCYFRHVKKIRFDLNDGCGGVRVLWQ